MGNIILGACLYFVIGTIFGSFYNVVIYRVPADESFISGSSHCMTCGHPLAWKDMIPILSYVSLGGKCRYCKTPYSPRYSVVEAIGGLIAACAFLSSGYSLQSLILFCFWSMLLVVAVIDMDQYIIIDEVWLTFTVISYALIVIEDYRTWYWPLLGAVTGFAFYGLIYLLSKFYYKEEAFGSGDVLLMAACGVVLLPTWTVLAGFGAFFVAGAFLLVLKLLKKEVRAATKIPFGPFIAISSFLCSLGYHLYQVLNHQVIINYSVAELLSHFI